MPTAQERDEQDPFARSLKEPGYRIAALRLQVDQTAALPTLGPPPSGLEGRIATRLPALSVNGPAGAVAPFPVLSGGLRWLDATSGTISGPPFSRSGRASTRAPAGSIAGRGSAT